MLYLDTLEAARVVDKAAESVSSGLSKIHQEAMQENADTCNYFQASAQNRSRKSCLYCVYLDVQVYCCRKLNKPVIPYERI